MNIKEELISMKNELAELKERIEADDAEAIERGMQLKADIEAKEKEVEAAEKKAAILNAIGEKQEDEKPMEGIKSLDLESLKLHKGSVQTFVKAATDAVTAPTIPTVSQRVAEIRYNLGVRDLLNEEAISGNSYTYFRMGATELPDSFDGTVTQGNAKPQIHPTYTTVTAALVKKACILKETDELLSDAPYLADVVRGRGVYELRKAIESYLVSTILGTSGIDVTVNDGISFDNLLKAKMAVQGNTGHEADAVIINPTDLQTLLLTKDGSGGSVGQYLMGGPAYAPYGNGSYGAYLPIWGMRVVATSAIAQGTALVGAFEACASLITKAGEGLRVEVANQNEDDFEKNMVTVRIEERILEAVRLPGGFAKVYTASTTTT